MSFSYRKEKKMMIFSHHRISKTYRRFRRRTQFLFSKHFFDIVFYELQNKAVTAIITKMRYKNHRAEIYFNSDILWFLINFCRVYTSSFCFLVSISDCLYFLANLNSTFYSYQCVEAIIWLWILKKIIIH